MAAPARTLSARAPTAGAPGSPGYGRAQRADAEPLGGKLTAHGWEKTYQSPGVILVGIVAQCVRKERIFFAK